MEEILARVLHMYLEDATEKTFDLIRYYLQQAHWRKSKTCVETAASYCNDIIHDDNLPQQIKDKALYLRGMCYLMLGTDEDIDIKHQCFREAAKLFLQLKTISLDHKAYTEFNINENLINDFFNWNRQRNANKLGHYVTN